MINDRPHKKLVVWKKSMELVVKLYELTKKFPKTEEYGLSSQLRRAAVSVPSNIAEGLTHRTSKDRIHFLIIAQGSLSEIDTQIELSQMLSYISIENRENIQLDIAEIGRLLTGLIRSLR